MKFRKLLIILPAVLVSLFIFTVVSPCEEIPIHFTGVKPTPSSCTYGGSAVIDGTDAADGEDEIGVFVSDDSGGEILVGSCVMGQTLAGYYFLHVYADDPETPDKDGADHHEELTFKIWDKSEEREYVVAPASPYMIYEPDAYGYLERPPQIPPIWQNGTIKGLGLLNLLPPVGPADIDGSGSIDLKDMILVLQILAKVTPDRPFYLDSDINENDRLGMEEAVYVLQYVAEMAQPEE